MVIAVASYLIAVICGMFGWYYGWRDDVNNRNSYLGKAVCAIVLGTCALFVRFGIRW